MKKIPLKPGDFIILIAILTASCFLIGTQSHKKKSASIIRVQADNDSYEYSLDKNGIYDIQGAIGITKMEVKDGTVRILDSPCPNKTCVDQGTNLPLVCLPNKVIITVYQTGEFDAFAQ